MSFKPILRFAIFGQGLPHRSSRTVSTMAKAADYRTLGDDGFPKISKTVVRDNSLRWFNDEPSPTKVARGVEQQFFAIMAKDMKQEAAQIAKLAKTTNHRLAQDALHHFHRIAEEMFCLRAYLEKGLHETVTLERLGILPPNPSAVEQSIIATP